MDAAKLLYGIALDSLVRQAVKKLPGRDPLRDEVKVLDSTPAKAKLLFDKGLISDTDMRSALQTFAETVDVYVEAARREADINLQHTSFGAAAVTYLLGLLRKRISIGSDATSIPDQVGREVLYTVAGGSGVERSAVVGFAGAQVHADNAAPNADLPPSFTVESPTQTEFPQTMYRWVHGLYRTPEVDDENHLALDGTEHDAPKPVGEFFPGDHPNCSCGFVPFSKLPAPA